MCSALKKSREAFLSPSSEKTSSQIQAYPLTGSSVSKRTGLKIKGLLVRSSALVFFSEH